MTLFGEFVVGVNLQGQVAGGVNYLYEQRESGSEAADVFFTNKGGTIFFDHLGQGLSGIGAVFHD